MFTKLPSLVYVAVPLSVALLCSVALNAWQARNAIRVQAQWELKEQIIERDAIIAAGKSLQDHYQIIDRMFAYDSALLLDNLWKIAERSRERVTVYRDRVSTLPLPACAPGAERQDAVNQFLESVP